ncbi:hypothetical protein BH10PLA2_BH10PLA2_22740 [soil metagenome]
MAQHNVGIGRGGANGQGPARDGEHEPISVNALDGQHSPGHVGSPRPEALRWEKPNSAQKAHSVCDIKESEL